MYRILLALTWTAMAHAAEPPPRPSKPCGSLILGVGSPLNSRAAEGLARLGVSAPERDIPVSIFDAQGQQASEAATFVADLYTDVLGDFTHAYLFQEVRIVPFEQIGRELSLQGTRLVIGVKRGRLYGRKLLTAYQIRTAWDRGDHLQTEKEKRYWPFVNPGGSFRIGIRSKMGKARDAFAQKFAALKGMSLEEKRKGLISLIRNARPANAPLEARIQAISDTMFDKFISDIEAGIHDPKRIAELEHAGIEAIAQSSFARDYDIEIKGLVMAYGNCHDIHVDIPTSRFTTLLRAVEKPRPMKVRVSAWFAGYTIDNIGVSLDFTGVFEASVIQDALEGVAP